VNAMDYKKQKGFTMIEMVIVTAILSILIAIAIPQMTQFIKGYRLNGATRVAWSDMQNARMTAIKENRSIRVEFTSPTSYRFVRTDTSEVISTRDLTAAYPNVTVISSGGSIIFNSRGTTDPTTITVSLSGSTKEFTIAWTGRIQGI